MLSAAEQVAEEPQPSPYHLPSGPGSTPTSPTSSCNTADLMAATCIPDTLLDPAQQSPQNSSVPKQLAATQHAPPQAQPSIMPAPRHIVRLPVASNPCQIAPQRQQFAAGPAAHGSYSASFGTACAGASGKPAPAAVASQEQGLPATSSILHPLVHPALRSFASAPASASGSMPPGKEDVAASASYIDLADGDSHTGACLVPKPAAGRPQHKAPSFSTKPGSRARGLASGDFIKEVRP